MSRQDVTLPKQPWTTSLQQILETLSVDAERGLDNTAASKKQQTYGLNKLRETQSRSGWDIFVDQFKSVIVLLLVAAAIAALIFGQFIDSAAIIIVVIINAAVGFVTEFRAMKSMAALRQMSAVSTKVRRDGQAKEISAEKLVPGDIVLLEAGDIITADLRLREASKMQVNESALTGESVPVTKQIEPLDAETPLAERSNMVFKGTAITRGSGEGVVVATGMDTELGQISSLVEDAESDETPLEQRLDAMGRKLVWITIAVAVAVALLGIYQEKELLLMVETSIALAVAAIPEGLPIVATLALAQGMQRMAKRNALVNRLAAVETLGGTNVICTDKTGTLTENQMTVTRFVFTGRSVGVSGEGLELSGKFSRDDEPLDPTQDETLRSALEIGVLCNNGSLPDEGDDDKAIGDPVEIALLVAGAKANLRRDALLDDLPEEREEAFDSDTKMMATFHQTAGGEYRVAVKGAPEEVLAVCTHVLEADGQPQEITDDLRQTWEDHNQSLAEDGLRILTLAQKTVNASNADPYTDLTLVGLVGMVDPPREEVRDVIAACQDAGVRVVMVTGDQPVTARNVALALGLVKDGDESKVIHGGDLKPLADMSASEREQVQQAAILARVSPRQKLDLIDIHQQNGHVVAMTGDGVNDAPALKKANIGVAMGQRGTQVAKEAADMVLQDDAFGSIVAAIKQGRVIFKNIRKFVMYLHSGNSCKIITVALASAINAPLPILPLQILYLNVITDVFPALALGVGAGEKGIMQQPPRNPNEPILTNRHWSLIAMYGILITVATLSALGLALTWLGFEQEQAITVSFLTLAFSQLWHVLNMRDLNTNLFNNEVTTNRYMWGAVALCIGLLVGAVYLPGLSDALQVSDPGLNGWLLILGMSLMPVTVGQVLKLFGVGRI